MIFPQRNCFACTHHRDHADEHGHLASHCAAYQDPIDHEVVAAADCPSYTPRPCEHTLTRWTSHHDDDLGVIAWSRCCDCGALVTTVARAHEGQIP